MKSLFWQKGGVCLQLQRPSSRSPCATSEDVQPSAHRRQRMAIAERRFVLVIHQKRVAEKGHCVTIRPDAAA